MSRIFTALVACSFVACVPDVSEDFDFDFDDSYTPSSNAQGRMSGELPHIGAFETNDATVARIDRDGDYVWLELHTVDDAGRWAMVYAEAPRDVRPNEEVVLDPMYAIGCSGPEMNWAEFDESPEAVSVTKQVIEQGDAREVTWHLWAEFANGDVVEGDLGRSPAGDGE